MCLRVNILLQEKWKRENNESEMERLDHTNLDFEELSRLCSPFVQRLVCFVVENMHNEMETFFKDNCQAIDDDEEIHKHRYWDMFQGKSTASFFFCTTSAPRLCLSIPPGVACGHTGLFARS